MTMFEVQVRHQSQRLRKSQSLIWQHTDSIWAMSGEDTTQKESAVWRDVEGRTLRNFTPERLTENEDLTRGWEEVARGTHKTRCHHREASWGGRRGQPCWKLLRGCTRWWPCPLGLAICLRLENMDSWGEGERERLDKNRWRVTRNQ